MTLALALAAAGLVAGALLPALIARIPDRPTEGDDPAPVPYRELAAAPRLALWLAAATALVWALLGIARGPVADLPGYLLAGLLGVAMGYVDLRTQLLPDRLTLATLAGVGGWLGVAAALTGSWGGYGRAWAAAGACLAFYLLLALLRPADLGLGDVKLSAALGLLLGWAGWSTVVLGVFLAFLAGGLAGIALLAAGRAGRRTSLPFGPPMLAGALLALLISG